MRTFSDICYSQTSGQCLDIYLPECDSFPVLIYFHGGGLEEGDKAGEQLFFNYMTSQGVAVVSANYRMYPDAKYPDFLVDAAEAVAWVFANITRYGITGGIYVGGTSAGGYISQMLCFDNSWLGKQKIELMDISGFIHDAGQPTCHFNVLRERGLDTRRVIVDDTAPLYHVGENAQYPPMLIVVSDNDLVNRYEQTMLLISTLKHFGHKDNIYLRQMHGTHCAYVFSNTDDGVNPFGKIVTEFISNVRRIQ